MNRYKSLNHEKFLIKYHIIFSTKYRTKCLKEISEDVKSYMKLAEKDNWHILYMEIDKDSPDHIHFLISASPTARVCDIIHDLKQISTYYCWKNHYSHMCKYYWRNKHHLWTRGYFVSSIGEVSEDTLKEYILKQG